MLASRILRARAAPVADAGAPVERGIHGSIGRFLRAMEDRYKGVLHIAIEHRVLVIAMAILALAGSVALIPSIGVELMPATDESEVRVNAEMAVGTRLDLFEERSRRIEEIVRETVPERTSMVTSVGGSPWRPGGTHTGEVRIALVPRGARRRSSEDIAADLRKRLSEFPGMIIRTRAGEGLFVVRLAMPGEERIQVEVRGHDMETADALAARVRAEVEQVDGIADVRVSRESGSPEEVLIIDRRRAADLELTVSQIAETLQTALSGTRAGEYRDRGKEYRILVKLKEAERLSLREVLDLSLTNREGEAVVLRNVVAPQPRTGPVQIERKDQERLVAVSAEVSGRDLGSVIAEIRERLHSVPVPRDFAIALGGDYEEQQKAFSELLLSFALALVLVYMVMACQYESLRDPLVVMVSVPLAAIGVVLMLLLTDTTFNIQSYIGCIMLGGIVVNNAILLVDHTNLLRRRDGFPLREAIEEAGRRRLRPILMTALTTVLGLVPLALGIGEGGEAQAPMARAVIGGLLSSTLITLVIVPVVYSIFEGSRAGERT